MVSNSPHVSGPRFRSWVLGLGLHKDLPQTGSSQRLSILLALHKGVPHYKVFTKTLHTTGSLRRRSPNRVFTKAFPKQGLYKGIPYYRVFTKAFPTKGSSQRRSTLLGLQEGVSHSKVFKKVLRYYLVLSGVVAWLSVSHCLTIRRLPGLLGGHALVWLGLVWSTCPAVRRSHNVC